MAWFRRRTIRRGVSVKSRSIEVGATFTRTGIIFRWATRRIRVIICSWRRIWFVRILMVMFVISRSITIMRRGICTRGCFIVVSRAWMWTWIRTRMVAIVVAIVARGFARWSTITSTTVSRITRFIWRSFKMLIKGRSWRSRLWFGFFE